LSANTEHSVYRPFFCYALATGVVIAALLLRNLASFLIGSELPPFITFYPAIMLAALFCGLGPGLLAVALSTSLSAGWMLPQSGYLRQAHGSSATALTIYCGMGVCMNLLADRYRRASRRLAVAADDEKLRETTARKHSDEYLLAGEVRYRTVFQNSLDGIAINRIDDGTYIDLNQSFLDIVGYRREEVIGCSSLEIGIWADLRDRLRLMETLRQNSSVRDFEARFVRKNGEVFWGLMSASTIEVDGVPCTLTMTRDLSSAKDAEEKIRSLAFFDPLTGLPNRRFLLEHLRRDPAEIDGALHQKALLFIDLDHFKTLNDTLGHQIGDLLLQQVARRLQVGVSEARIVARLGSDEFVVVLEDLSEVVEEAATQVKATAERILASLSAPYMLDGRECLSTCSIGVTFIGDSSEGADEFLQQADLAMYQAKTAGRNTMRQFAPALQAAVNARASLEDDLRQAIKGKQFLLYYQPQVNRRVMIGAEALVRWQHPRRGLLLPGEFINLAEETGLILPLGDWVLEAACTQVAAWERMTPPAPISVAVNISARQFRQPDFVEQVLGVLRRTGASPEHIKLELTESMLADNIEEVIAKMAELKSHGLRFSLDDFGTGYSSLSYLKRLPLDQLKIDRAFVRDILVDASSGAIAQTIISLGRAMGLPVIAEGVETEEQREFLASLGCHTIQGYLYSRPVPLKDFQQMMPMGQA
jgi:diguanylate cyclase (GGDEF)-like protein/PAS domain S-box-containing protein